MYEFSASDVVYVVTSDVNLVVSELIIMCNHGDVAYLRNNYCTNMEELIFHEKPHCFLLFQINQPTRCNSFSSLLLDVYVQLNMFRASSRPSSGAQQLQ
jgi:hypothetical protein